MIVTLDLDELNLAEVDFIEQESGLTINDLASGTMNTRALMAVVVIQNRKTNPDYSMADAGKLKVSEIEVERADPTVPASAPRRKKAASS